MNRRVWIVLRGNGQDQIPVVGFTSSENGLKHALKHYCNLDEGWSTFDVQPSPRQLRDEYGEENFPPLWSRSVRKLAELAFVGYELAIGKTCEKAMRRMGMTKTKQNRIEKNKSSGAVTVEIETVNRWLAVSADGVILISTTARPYALVSAYRPGPSLSGSSDKRSKFKHSDYVRAALQKFSDLIANT